MTKREAEDIITKLWQRCAMDDHSGTDRVRDELEDLLLAAYRRGVEDGRKEAAT
jgi:hypothetical protein